MTTDETITALSEKAYPKPKGLNKRDSNYLFRSLFEEGMRACLSSGELLGPMVESAFTSGIHWAEYTRRPRSYKKEQLRLSEYMASIFPETENDKK